MSAYRSSTENALSGSPEDIGHTIGLAAVLIRLIEHTGNYDKDKIKELAGLLRDRALADVESMKDDKASHHQNTIKQQARQAINQVLLPLVNFETVQ
jgi:demethoxyubiquinone hydroxylase (CLK1/Coq7/Cat5 family)